MWTRRQFLSRSSLALAGTAGTCFAFQGDDAPFDDEPRSGRPDPERDYPDATVGSPDRGQR